MLIILVIVIICVKHRCQESRVLLEESAVRVGKACGNSIVCLKKCKVAMYLVVYAGLLQQTQQARSRLCCSHFVNFTIVCSVTYFKPSHAIRRNTILSP